MAIKLEDKKAIVAEVNEAAKVALSAVVADARGPGAAARIFKEFAKGQDKFEIKAAAFEGKFLAANEIDVLASLPTRDEAIAKLMSVIQGATSKLARTLAAIRDQKEATAA